MTDLMERVKCIFGMHEWKRAVRLIGTRGQQTCKRCGSHRYVVLRKGKPEPELVRTPVADGVQVSGEGFPSQWPPSGASL